MTGTQLPEKKDRSIKNKCYEKGVGDFSAADNDNGL